jgi:hypothetical protein
MKEANGLVETARHERLASTAWSEAGARAES